MPIKEHLVFEGKIYPVASNSFLFKTASQLNPDCPSSQSSLQPSHIIQESAHREFRDPVLNSVVALASETAVAGYGVLVFAGSRAACESDARWISRVLSRMQDTDPATDSRRIDLILELRALSSGIDPVLEETIPFGVAFHRK